MPGIDEKRAVKLNIPDVYASLYAITQELARERGLTVVSGSLKLAPSQGISHNTYLVEVHNGSNAEKAGWVIRVGRNTEWSTRVFAKEKLVSSLLRSHNVPGAFISVTAR